MVRWGLLWVGVAACVPGIDVERPEDAPTAAILSPAGGVRLRSGTHPMEGRVADEADAAERLFATWSAGPEDADATASWRELCRGFADEEGTTLCLAALEPADVLVRLDVVDVAGFRGRDVRRISVVDAAQPVVTLLSPRSDVPWFAHLPIAVEAVATDADDPVDGLGWRWESSLVGTLEGPDAPDGLGVVRGAVELGVGTHTLTVSVTDPFGGVGRDQVTIQVAPEDADPLCRIDQPTAGVVAQGAVVVAEGVVLDDVTEPLVARWMWDDAVLAEETADEVGWSTVRVAAGSVLGPHTLALEAGDGQGHDCRAEVEVVVDDPPSLVILQPEVGAVVAPSTSLTVSVQASDRVTPAEQIRLQASSDRDGPLFAATADLDGRLERTLVLSPGAHLLRVVATDEGGLEQVVERSVQVRP